MSRATTGHFLFPVLKNGFRTLLCEVCFCYIPPPDPSQPKSKTEHTTGFIRKQAKTPGMSEFACSVMETRCLSKPNLLCKGRRQKGSTHQSSFRAPCSKGGTETSLVSLFPHAPSASTSWSILDPWDGVFYSTGTAHTSINPGTLLVPGAC